MVILHTFFNECALGMRYSGLPYDLDRSHDSYIYQMTEYGRDRYSLRLYATFLQLGSSNRDIMLTS